MENHDHPSCPSKTMTLSTWSQAICWVHTWNLQSHSVPCKVSQDHTLVPFIQQSQSQKNRDHITNPRDKVIESWKEWWEIKIKKTCAIFISISFLKKAEAEIFVCLVLKEKFMGNSDLFPSIKHASFVSIINYDNSLSIEWVSLLFLCIFSCILMIGIDETTNCSWLAKCIIFCSFKMWDENDLSIY